MSPFAKPPRLAPFAGLLLAVLAVAGCGGSGSAGKASGSTVRFSGSTIQPAVSAPALRLRDYRGRPVDISSYRGKAVMVTFIYTHCPDTCPLIVSHLRTVQALLGPKSREMQVLAVSTDPRGDTPSQVAKFLKAHGMVGRMEYLIGSRAELGPVWKAWPIVAKPEKAGRELVAHSALIYGIGANGRLTTIYPANFRPAQIAHDVPLLAAR